MIDPKTLERLSNSKDFLLFLECLLEYREDLIGQFHEATTDKLHQLSGRILQLDELLALARYKEVSEKWRKMET